MRQYVTVLRHTKTIPILIVLVFSFQLLTMESQAWIPDTELDYKYFILPYVQHCNILQYPQRVDYDINSNGEPVYGSTSSPTRDPLKWWINCASYESTGSAKFIPIIFNVGIIPLTYLLATSLTKDRIIGLLAVTAIIANPIFTRFEGSGTYDQVWSFFLLLSVYLIYRFKRNVDLTVVSLFASLAAKGLVILYIPVWFYTLYKSEKPRLAKVVLGSVVVLGLVVIGIVIKSDFIIGGTISFHPENIELAISQNIKMLWEIIPVIIIAIGINRLCNPKQKIQNKTIPILWMLSGLTTTPLIYLFTNQLQFVYRFVPLLVFMSIYLGMVVVETGNFILEKRLSSIKSKI